jgi:hypothetical protein
LEEFCSLYIFKYFKENQNQTLEHHQQTKTQTFEIGFCRISYFKDFCYNLSNYLLYSVYEYKYLDNFNLYRFIDDENENISVDKIDIRLSQILKYSILPHDWTLLGDINDLNTSNNSTL